MATSISIPGPLKGARFVDRPNQFMVRVTLEPEETTVMAHLSDPGSLHTLLIPDRRLWVRPGPQDGRQVAWTAAVIQDDHGTLVSLDHRLPVPLVAAAIEQEQIEELVGWDVERADYAIGRSRVDFLLSTPAGDKMLLDVVGVTFRHGHIAYFPDAPRPQGVQHLDEIISVIQQPGWHATILFVAQRNDVQEFATARNIDPALCEAIDRTYSSGVRLMARRCQLTLEEITLGLPLAVQTYGVF